MKYSETFLKAAENLRALSDFTCVAIGRTDGLFMDSPARHWYESLYETERVDFPLRELSRVADSFHRRQIMLCLAAAIAESEGL